MVRFSGIPRQTSKAAPEQDTKLPKWQVSFERCHLVGRLISNPCIGAGPGRGAGCDSLAWQVFIAKQVDGTSFYEWVNAATGHVVPTDGIRSHLTGIKPPPRAGLDVESKLAA
jgi:hypothetical protein